MPEMQNHESGTISWTDLATTDIEGAKTFYGALFGWEFEPQIFEGELVYTMCTLNGLNVCGLGGTMGEEQPACWNIYTCVENVDATAARITAQGGSIIAGPMDVFESGRMAFIADAQQAMLGLWQPRNHMGAEIMMEPNTFMWAELMTRDPEGSAAFYQGVYGWDIVPDHNNPNYALFVPARDTSGTVYLAGQLAMDDSFSRSIPNHWGVYFQVEDIGAKVRHGVELGGTQEVPPTEIAQGVFAVMQDPQGAFFNLMQPRH